MNQEHWDKAKAFHGHECPGLAIGVKVCEAVFEKMGVSPALDEELVCITENDACGVDAVQALLGCTMGKGNLIYKKTGKQAFTFIKRSTGEAMRFYLKVQNNGLPRDEYKAYLLDAAVDDLFDCSRADVSMPEPARKFASIKCTSCGEAAAEHRMRLQDGQQVCLSCFRKYGRSL